MKKNKKEGLRRITGIISFCWLQEQANHQHFFHLSHSLRFILFFSPPFGGKKCFNESSNIDVNWPLQHSPNYTETSNYEFEPTCSAPEFCFSWKVCRNMLYKTIVYARESEAVKMQMSITRTINSSFRRKVNSLRFTLNMNCEALYSIECLRFVSRLFLYFFLCEKRGVQVHFAYHWPQSLAFER